MLNFNTNTKKEEVKMYQMVIGKMEVKMSEVDMQKVIDLVNELGYQFTESKKQTQPKKAESKVSQPEKQLKSAEKESAEKAIAKHNRELKYVGTQIYADRDITITLADGIYRLYCHITKAKDGNPEKTAFKKKAIKDEFKAYGFKYAAGSYEAGMPFWACEETVNAHKYMVDRQKAKDAFKKSLEA